MQISFEQEDVERAIALYLRSMGITANVANVSFVAGRKDSGLRTTIDLEDVEHDPIPSQPLKREVLGSVVGRSSETPTSSQTTDSVPDESADAPDGDGAEQETNPLPPEEKDEQETLESDNDAGSNENDGMAKKSIFD